MRWPEKRDGRADCYDNGSCKIQQFTVQVSQHCVASVLNKYTIKKALHCRFRKLPMGLRPFVQKYLQCRLGLRKSVELHQINYTLLWSARGYYGFLNSLWPQHPPPPRPPHNNKSVLHAKREYWTCSERLIKTYQHQDFNTKLTRSTF